jgi:putative hydrolase of the HAD superfamily
LATLDARSRADLLVDHARLTRTVRLAPGAAAVLEELRRSELPVGIASNAQAYTHVELADALAPVGLGLDLFDPGLTFWSFEHGFSKPDPHVFRILTARLAGRGIRPPETLMVGDRQDNDIDPARRAGWDAWHVDPADPGPCWDRLQAHLLASTRSLHP